MNNHHNPTAPTPRIRTTHGSHRGFTLVELLTVIAITAVLGLILFATISSVRESARSVTSTSNLRQWGVALQVYLADNAGAIPYEGDRDSMTWSSLAHNNNARAWFNVLPPYVNATPLKDLQTNEERNYLVSETTIFKCPLVEFPTTRSPAVRFSYMMNSQLYHPQAPSDSPDQPLTISHIAEPAITVMFADGAQISRARGRGNHVDARHRSGETNIVFFDGSVRRFPADYVRQESMTVNGIAYSDNNKPDIIWNPWTNSHLSL